MLINQLFGVGSAYVCGPGKFSGTNGVATGVNILRVNNLSLANTSSEVKERNKSHYEGEYFPQRSITNKLKNASFLAKRAATQ